MAAERAAELSEKAVTVVPSRCPQAGLLAVISLDGRLGLEENARRMTVALGTVRTGAVAPAAREDPEGRFAVGDAVGYVGDALVAWGDPAATLGAVLAGLADGSELITAIRGQDAPLDEEVVATLVPDGVELDAQDGGQPSWWWLLAAE
jgi:dihydroxyacetone kinase-like predicted kinase